MLRIFTFDEKRLGIHNERFAYIPVDSEEEITKGLENTKDEEVFETNFYHHYPLYVNNYAVVKSNEIELRSVLNPGKSIKIEEDELTQAIYQYYQVEHIDFYVFYKDESDLQFLKENSNCQTSQPIFTKIKKCTKEITKKYVESRLKKDSSGVNLNYYYIDEETHQLILTSLMEEFAYRTHDVVVDKVESIPLSNIELYYKLGNDDGNYKTIDGYRDINRCYDDDDFLRDEITYVPQLKRNMD